MFKTHIDYDANTCAAYIYCGYLIDIWDVKMYFLFLLCFLIEKGFSTLLETNFSKALIFQLFFYKNVAYRFLNEWRPISTGIMLCLIVK